MENDTAAQQDLTTLTLTATGPTGCGKSVLLGKIARAMQQAGFVVIDGSTYANQHRILIHVPRRNVQFPDLKPVATVTDNIRNIELHAMFSGIISVLHLLNEHTIDGGDSDNHCSYRRQQIDELIQRLRNI